MLPFILFTAVVVGGIDMATQSLTLSKKPHIIIGKIFFFLIFLNFCFFVGNKNIYIFRIVMYSVALIKVCMLKAQF